MKNKWWIQAILGLVFVMSLSAVMMAQNQPNPGRGRGQTGQSPAEVQQQQQQRSRQARIDRIKVLLGSTEEEWAVLGPKVEKIQELNTDADAPVFAVARRIPGAIEVFQPLIGTSAMAQKMQVLQQAIDSPAIADSEIKSRLVSVRAERARIHEELAKVRAELTQLLTQRQEAILFTVGIIE